MKRKFRKLEASEYNIQRGNNMADKLKDTLMWVRGKFGRVALEGMLDLFWRLSCPGTIGPDGKPLETYQQFAYQIAVEDTCRELEDSGD